MCGHLVVIIYPHAPLKSVTAWNEFHAFGRALWVHPGMQWPLKEWLSTVSDGGLNTVGGHQSFSQAVGHRSSWCRKQPSCCSLSNQNNATIRGAGRYPQEPVVLVFLSSLFAIAHLNVYLHLLSLFILYISTAKPTSTRPEQWSQVAVWNWPTGNESPIESISCTFEQLCPLTHKANKQLQTRHSSLLEHTIWVCFYEYIRCQRGWILHRKFILMLSNRWKHYYVTETYSI